MKKYNIRESRRVDCYELSKSLKKEDVQEIFASSGNNPIQVLLRAYLYSARYCYSVVLDNKVVGMFGITKLRDGVGIPWLLGSNVLTQFPLAFHKETKEYLDKFMKEFKVLFNYVDQRNTIAIKWLKILGFTFTKLIHEFGYQKKPFFEFVKG